MVHVFINRFVDLLAPRLTRSTLPNSFIYYLCRYAEYDHYSSAPALLHTCNLTGSIEHMDPITRGDGVTQRIGKAWKYTSVQIQGFARPYLASESATGTTLPNSIGRMYIIWDYQPNGALAAKGDFMLAVGGLFDPTCFVNRDNQSRFKILWMKEFIINSGSTMTYTTLDPKFPSIQPFSANIPCHCIAKATQANQDGVIGGRIQGAFLAFFCGNQASTGGFPVAYQVRFNFRDIRS